MATGKVQMGIKAATLLILNNNQAYDIKADESSMQHRE